MAPFVGKDCKNTNFEVLPTERKPDYKDCIIL